VFLCVLRRQQAFGDQKLSIETKFHEVCAASPSGRSQRMAWPSPEESHRDRASVAARLRAASDITQPFYALRTTMLAGSPRWTSASSLAKSLLR